MHTFQLLIAILLCPLMQLQSHAQTVPESEAGGTKQVRIGLLLTEDPENSTLMREAENVAKLSAEIVNKAGGIGQKPVQIISKSVDGNWGAGSKQAVSLIYEYQTTALLGFVDGRSAHLIEQVCTKAEIPFISTLSPDPSLSRINIPWFFSTLPHAEQQAVALTEHLYSNGDAGNTLVVTSDNYDQGFLSRSFVEIAAREYHNNPVIFSYTEGENDFSGIGSDIAESNADAIVFFGAPSELENLTEQLTSSNVGIPIYTAITDMNTDLSLRSSMPLYTLKPRTFTHQDTEAFYTLFYERYGYSPGIQTTYLYDALQLLLRAIRENGEASDPIREALVNMSEPASFDSDGVIEQALTVVQVHSKIGNR